MTSKLDHPIECPMCGGRISSMRCNDCAHEYSTVFGVPFIGAFQTEDVLGLIEIAANIPNRQKLKLDPAWVDELEQLCERYAVSEHRDDFLQEINKTHGAYFLNQYAEWEEVNLLTKDLQLAGCSVLDVGAGLGYDSYRLHRKGCNVTALEFSPLLLEAGSISFPQINWIGGLAHALPFADASFDAVFFNAALHHMRELPTVISEALRVLKVGGTLITTCDSFRSDEAPLLQELQIFDANEAVLLGVNEQIPRFSEFTQILVAHADCLDFEIYTHTLYGGLDGKSPDITTLERWEQPAFEYLRHRSGSLAMRVLKRRPLHGSRGKIDNFALRPDAYAELLTDQGMAISSLAALVPQEYVNRDLLSPATKFDLLNGWRLPREGDRHRQAFKRARWFMRRRFAKKLRLKLRSGQPAPFKVLIDGEVKHHSAPATGWTDVVVDLSCVPAGKVFALELQKEVNDASFEVGSFDVANIVLDHPIDGFFNRFASWKRSAAIG